MLPSELQPGQFSAYPPEARELAAAHLALLQKLPTVFVALLLREVIAYDWKFPAERQDLDRQLTYLASLSPEQLKVVLAGFEQVRLSDELERFDWVSSPERYSQRLTAHLWASHQIDAFHVTADGYISKFDAAAPPEPVPVPRLGLAVVGQGVLENKYPLFRKLRKHGVYFSQVKADNGLEKVLRVVASRAGAHPVPYAHWYIDGGEEAAVPTAGVTRMSYQTLEPVRTVLLKKMERAIQSGIGGPEALHSMMAELRPEEVGLSAGTEHAVLNHFQLSVLTEGSGTQIFSTAFVQWTAREALRRARPLTLLARYAPRQRQRPMNELLSGKQQNVELDPAGSLIDGDMGAYYTWLNQQRLSGADRSGFLVWFEGHADALAIGPSFPRGTESNNPVDLSEVLGQLA
jgi:hypothetical protein